MDVYIITDWYEDKFMGVFSTKDLALESILNETDEYEKQGKSFCTIDRVTMDTNKRVTVYKRRFGKEEEVE